MAPDQTLARRYYARLCCWFPAGQAEHQVRLAVSDVSNAHEAIAAFRLRPEPAVLCTVRYGL